MKINIYKYLKFAFNPYSYKEYRHDTKIKDEIKSLEFWKNLSFDERLDFIIEHYDKNGPYRKYLILDLDEKEDKKLFKAAYTVIKEKEIVRLEKKKKKDIDDLQKRINRLMLEQEKIVKDKRYGCHILDEVDVFTEKLFV